MPLPEDLMHDARIEMETDAAYDEHETHAEPDPECWLCTQRAEEEAADCRTCEEIKTKYAGFGPPHKASGKCESGAHPHCSCDICF